MTIKKRFRPGAVLIAATGMGTLIHMAPARAQQRDFDAGSPNGYTAEVTRFAPDGTAVSRVWVHNLPDATTGVMIAPVESYAFLDATGQAASFSSAVKNAAGQTVGVQVCVQPTQATVTCQVAGPGQPPQTQVYARAMMETIAGQTVPNGMTPGGP